MVGKFSYSSQAALSRRCWMYSGEIVLLATTHQMTMRDVQPGASKRISPPCSFLVFQSVVGRFSYSPQAGHLSSFSTWWGDPFTLPRLDISGCRSARGGQILLLAQAWTSLVIVRCVVGRFSHSPQAGHLWSSFGMWWGDSLTCPKLDIPCRNSAHGGEILLLASGWTSLVVVRRMVGRFSYSPQAGHLWLSFGSWWGDSLGRCSARGGEIFSYSTQAGHLWSSLCAWWGVSLTRPRLDISGRRSVRGGEILLLTPGLTSLVVVWRVVGRFSYLPQAGHLWSSFVAWWGDSLTSPRLDISSRRLAHGGEILLLISGWTSLVVVWHVVGRFFYSPQAGHLWLSSGAW